MVEIRFYHLRRARLEDALPQLLERALARGWRSVVMAGSAERVERLNRHLWTYAERSFLPHGAAADGHAADQPIWLTDREENPNAAQVLFLTDGATAAVEGYLRVCEVFDGADAEAVAAARDRWRSYRAAGHTVSYWQQGEDGSWQEKTG